MNCIPSHSDSPSKHLIPNSTLSSLSSLGSRPPTPNTHSAVGLQFFVRLRFRAGVPSTRIRMSTLLLRASKRARTLNLLQPKTIKNVSPTRKVKNLLLGPINNCLLFSQCKTSRIDLPAQELRAKLLNIVVSPTSWHSCFLIDHHQINQRHRNVELLCIFFTSVADRACRLPILCVYYMLTKSSSYNLGIPFAIGDFSASLGVFNKNGKSDPRSSFRPAVTFEAYKFHCQPTPHFASL